VPSRDGRLHILKIHTGAMPRGDDVDLGLLADRTRGYTGADLEDLVRRAGLQALRADLGAERVFMDFFKESLKQTRASVTPEMEREYEKLLDELKRESPRSGRIGFAIPGIPDLGPPSLQPGGPLAPAAD
jgi:transitional endoplasmic reticulum ATPase